MSYFEEGYRFLRLIGENETTLRGRVMSYLNIGQTYRVLHDCEKAILFYDKGLSLITDAESKGLNISMEDKVSLYNSKANIYRDIKEEKKALVLYSIAIDLLENEIKNKKTVSMSLYIMLLANRMYIYEQLGMKEEYKLDAEKYQRHYGKANILTIEHVEQNNEKQENMHIVNPNILYESANADIKKGRINSALEKLKRAIFLDDNNPSYFLDYAYCFSEVNDNANAAINTLRGLSLIAPTYETIQTGGCKLSTLKTYGKEDYMLQILDVQTMNTYSMYLYLKLIGEFSRAIMHFNYGWYLEAHSINMGEMVLSAQKPDMLTELRRKDNAEIIRDVMREAIKKGRRVNDIAYGDKLLKNAKRILDTKELSTEDINDTFVKWIPDVQAGELERLQKIFSFDMIAFEMMNRSLEYGSLNALRFIRDFYENPNYFAYDENVSKKLFVERNGIVELR